MRKDLKKGGKWQNNQVSGRKQKHQVFSDEEYIRRAEKLERELFADGEWDEVDEPTDEEEARSYEELIKRLKAEGIYQEDDIPEEDTEKNIDLETFSRVIPMYKKRSVRVGRVAGVAILCCACVFAASMTSEANRNYLVKGVRYLVGDDTRIVVDNNEENEISNMEEGKAIENIEDQLDIDMPEFYYRPEMFEFYNYEINTYADIARLEYLYYNNIITVYVDKEKEDSASQNNSLHGGSDYIFEIGGEEISVSIQKSKDDVPSYSAQWERNDVLYHLSGRIDKEELIKIIENIVF